MENAYFKGGTALYKALKSIRRFSEDVDLTVCVSGCPSKSQAQKRLKDAVLKFTSLEKGRTLEDKKGSVTCEYLYETLFKSVTDPLQRFGSVKVEGTSFTVSKPHEGMMVSPYIYELSTDEQKEYLQENFGVGEFEVPTISLERIFVDKVFALEFYYARGKLMDVSKHAYDLAVLSGDEKIQSFLKNKRQLKEIMDYERQEQEARFGGIADSAQVRDFAVFKDFFIKPENEEIFDRMQRIYVFDSADRLALKDIRPILEDIRLAF